MPLPQKISELKAFQKPQDSIFTTLITRRISRVFSYLILKYDKNATPNQISVLSFFMAFFACVLIIYDNYWYRIIGVIFLQIAFAFDCSDGEIARYKNMSSKFGAWLDSVFDRFKEVLMFSALTYLAYIKTLATHILLIGIAAMVLWLLVGYLREAKKASWPVARKAEIFITKNIYLGTVDIIIFLVCVAIILQMEFYALLIFLAAAIPLLIKQIISAWKLSKEN